MKRKSKKAIKRIMVCLSIFMLTGLFLNIALNNNLSLGCHDLSFQGIGGTSLVIFGIGLNKFSDFFKYGNQIEKIESKKVQFQVLFRLIPEKADFFHPVSSDHWLCRNGHDILPSIERLTAF